MKPNNASLMKFSLSALLMTLLTACSSASKISCAAPEITPEPLPLSAQQPQPISLCLPTCLDGLTELRESLQKLPDSDM
ncbi:o-spanin [Pararheinheimera phage vB_PsoM_KLER1-1]|nr:o-spanin [Pararheinheimera phage vB_PsoM_KLER1-1]